LRHDKALFCILKSELKHFSVFLPTKKNEETEFSRKLSKTPLHKFDTIFYKFRSIQNASAEKIPKIRFFENFDLKIIIKVLISLNMVLGFCHSLHICRWIQKKHFGPKFFTVALLKQKLSPWKGFSKNPKKN